MKELLIFLALSCLVGSAVSVVFTACAQQVAKVDNVTVDGCSASDDICELVIGGNATLNAHFVPYVASSNATVTVFAKVAKSWIPFPLKEHNACTVWGVTCPIVPGGNYHLRVGVPVLKGYPTIKTSVRVNLADSNGDCLLCQEFPAQIVDPS